MKNPALSTPGRHRLVLRSLLGAALCLAAIAIGSSEAAAAGWKITKGSNDDLPGQNVTVTQDGNVVARLIYGEGQPLPYLAVYDRAGRRLTNPGIDKSGQTVGIEPHHRGIFIGWQQIKSDLGVHSLWGLGAGNNKKKGDPSTMRLVEIVRPLTADAGTNPSPSTVNPKNSSAATIAATARQGTVPNVRISPATSPFTTTARPSAATITPTSSGK